MIKPNLTKSYLKQLIYEVNGAAIEVHKTIGPGLLENIYHNCMKEELRRRKINFQTEFPVQVIYKDVLVGQADLKCDLLIEGVLPVELKAIEFILPVHKAQLLTYMNLLQAPEGLLINFNVVNIFKEGQQTLVNDLYRMLAK